MTLNPALGKAPERRVARFFEPCLAWWALPADLQAPRQVFGSAHQPAEVTPCFLIVGSKNNKSITHTPGGYFQKALRLFLVIYLDQKPGQSFLHSPEFLVALQ